MSHDAREGVCTCECTATEDGHFIDCPDHEHYEAYLAMRRPATLSPMGLLEEVREALDMCRAIIKFHVKAGKSCSFSPEQTPFSALDAYAAAVNALAKLPKLTGEGM